MILVEGEKYACVQCIRGHRSSTCQHTKRALVQVRSRGRPNNGLDHRVTVFADEHTETPVQLAKSTCCSSVKNEDSDSDVPKSTRDPSPPQQRAKGSSYGSLAAEKQPVIVLKASRKQLYNVSKGSFSLLGPVAASDTKPLVNRAKPHSGKCTKCQRHMTRTAKSSVRNRLVDMSSSSLSSLITTEDDSSRNTPIPPSSSSSVVLKNEFLVQPIENGNHHGTLAYGRACKHSQNNEDTCHCEDENCSCERCSVHNTDSNKISEQKSSAGPLPSYMDSSTGFLSSNLLPLEPANSSGITGPTNTNANTNSFAEMMQSFASFNSFQSIDTYDPMDDCSCLPDECSCYNCPKHLIVDGIRLSDGVRVADSPFSSAHATPDVGQASDHSTNGNRVTIQNLLFNEFSIEEAQELMEDCLCPPDDCNCLNCFKHGIFNNEVVNFETPALKLVPKTENDVEVSNFNTYTSQI